MTYSIQYYVCVVLGDEETYETVNGLPTAAQLPVQRPAPQTPHDEEQHEKSAKTADQKSVNLSDGQTGEKSDERVGRQHGEDRNERPALQNLYAQVRNLTPFLDKSKELFEI